MRKPRVPTSDIATSKVIDMIIPIIAEAKMKSPFRPTKKLQKKEEVKKPQPMFGMVDIEPSKEPTPLKKGRPAKVSPKKLTTLVPFIKKRDMKAE